MTGKLTAMTNHKSQANPSSVRLASVDPMIDQVLEEDHVVSRDQITWSGYLRMAGRVQSAIARDVVCGHWEYRHPPQLQFSTPDRLRKQRNVRASYTRLGNRSARAVICLGGIAGVARRFDRLARHLEGEFQVVAMDWVGRGRSGWLPEQGDYSQAALVEQVLQLTDHLGLTEVSLVGSSLGGSVAMAVAAMRPDLVRSLVLNDIGPFMPAQRRSRRAQSVARHYVFRRPVDLFQRTGAAQKNDGPVDDATLLCNSFHMTKWSDDEDGRIYRHDPRALAAYRSVACHDLDQWDDWRRLTCPVLVVHGMCSDALTFETVDRMTATRGADVIHVPDTGHTPTLTEPRLLAAIGDWLLRPGCTGQRTILPRQPSPKRVLFVDDRIEPDSRSIEAAA